MLVPFNPYGQPLPGVVPLMLLPPMMGSQWQHSFNPMLAAQSFLASQYESASIQALGALLPSQRDGDAGALGPQHSVSLDRLPVHTDFMSDTDHVAPDDAVSHHSLTPRALCGRQRGRDHESQTDADSCSDTFSETSSARRRRRRKEDKVPLKSHVYSGQDQSFNLEDFTEYLSQHERYHGWTEKEFLEHALICLTGPVLTCVSENERRITNWKQLRQLLHDTLEPEGNDKISAPTENNLPKKG
jgi:hypothetical protein